MQDKIKQIREKAVAGIEKATSLQELDDIRVSIVGKKGELTELLKTLKDLSIEEKKIIGKESNKVKSEIFQLLESRKNTIAMEEMNKTLTEGSLFDISLPGVYYSQGSLHPVTIVRKEIEKVFTGMGFCVVSGPEAEEDFYNFEALNIPKHHPARDAQDTYWLTNGQLLRTHTSPVQIRAMLKHGAPLKIIAPGRCFRNEKIDASHENTFFQLEGMMIDKHISIANLIYVMKLLLKEILKKEVTIRLRPGFFPFVEPGFELDLQCEICNGKGCATCKQSGWIEILPCGMVHPNVIRSGGLDPEEYTGFAFGLGLTRLAMMKYGIGDIRVFNSGDLRVLRTFGTM